MSIYSFIPKPSHGWTKDCTISRREEEDPSSRGSKKQLAQEAKEAWNLRRDTNLEKMVRQGKIEVTQNQPGWPHCPPESEKYKQEANGGVLLVLQTLGQRVHIEASGMSM